MPVEIPALGRMPDEESPIRRHAKKALKGGATKFHKAFPNARPNHLSGASLAAGIVGDSIIAHENRREVRRSWAIGVGLGLKTAQNLGDGEDGPLADVINEENPGTVNTLTGDTVDAFCDRVGELVAAINRVATARRKGSRWGVLAASGVEVTTVVPSFIKFDKKRRGIVIHEVGNPVAALGSRPGRVVLDAGTSIFPRTQPILDTVGALANVYSAGQRAVSVGREGYTPEQRKQALVSEGILAALETAAVAHVLHSRHKDRGTSSKSSLTVDVLKGGMVAAAIPLVVALADMNTEQLQKFQRILAPSKKWRKKQPDHRDALRYVSEVVSGHELQEPAQRLLKRYPTLSEDAIRVREAIERREFEGKVCVVTGATGKIGQALTKRLAQMGAEVVMCSRDKEKAGRVGQEISQELENSNINANISTQKLNLSDQESISEAIDDLTRKFPEGIDMIVNAAGVTPAESIERNIELNEWTDINYLGPVILTLGLFGQLKKDGRVVNLTSSSQNGNRDDYAEGIYATSESEDPYHGSKLLLETIMVGLEEATRDDPKGIGFLTVHPGNIHKELSGRKIKARASRVERLKPLLSSGDEAALGIIRALLTGDRSKRYAYGKPAEFPEAVTDPNFQEHVALATINQLDNSAKELIGPRLQKLAGNDS